MTTPKNQELKLPDKYAKLGVRQGFEPTPSDSLSFILEAPPGCGKTQFVMSMPDTLVLDFDAACQSAVAQRAHYLTIPHWERYEEVKAFLADDMKAGACPFKRVVLDTADTALKVLDQKMLAPLNVTRKGRGQHALGSILEWGESGAGYAKLGQAFLRELLSWKMAGFAIGITNHMRTRVEKLGDTLITSRRCAMAPTIMEMMLPHVDIKARMYRSTKTVKEMKTKSVADGKGGQKKVDVATGKSTTAYAYWLGVMPTEQSSADDDTKRRVPHFSGVIQLPLVDGYGAFRHAYEEAVEAAKSIK